MVAPSPLSRRGTTGRRAGVRERVLLSLVHRYEPAAAPAIARALGMTAAAVNRALHELAADGRAACVAEAGGRSGARGGRSPALWVAAEEPRGLFGWEAA